MQVAGLRELGLVQSPQVHSDDGRPVLAESASRVALVVIARLRRAGGGFATRTPTRVVAWVHQVRVCE
jgi:hypothetical protein